MKPHNAARVLFLFVFLFALFFSAKSNKFVIAQSSTPPMVDAQAKNILSAVPGQPLYQIDLSYDSDDIALGNDGIVYLLNRVNNSILRWSIAGRSYLDVIPLERAPKYMAYAPETNRLFLAYHDGFLTRFDLDQSMDEIQFGVLPASPCGIISAGGSFLATCDDSLGEYNKNYSTYSMSGEKLSSIGNGKSFFGWDPLRRRVYMIPEYNSYDWVEIDDTGHFSRINIRSKEGLDYPPMRMSPDSSVFFLGRQKIVNADTLKEVVALPNFVSDGFWLGQSFYTIKEDQSTYPYQTKTIQKWDLNYTLQTSRDFPDNILHIFPRPGGVLAVAKVDDAIQFLYLNYNLGEVSPSPLAEFSAEKTQGYSPLEVTFKNLSSGDENSYLWDFGDGSTSTETNPIHTYTTAGIYTVKLIAKNASGEDTKTAAGLILAKQKTFLPFVINQYPTKTFDNMCGTAKIWISGYGIAYVKECVKSVEVRVSNIIRINFSWTLDNKVFPGCIKKESDRFNPDMYMTDQNNNKYKKTNAGLAADDTIYCMVNGEEYLGWFDFPGPLVTDPLFTFHDDDNQLLFGPITLPVP